MSYWSFISIEWVQSYECFGSSVFLWHPVQDTFSIVFRRYQVERCLGACRCVRQIKWHLDESENSGMANEYRFVLILFIDLHLPVFVIGVQGCKLLGFTECIDALVHVWKGYVSFTVMEFSFLVSIQDASFSSFLRANSTGAAHADMTGSMIPAFSFFYISARLSSRVSGAARYGGTWTGTHTFSSRCATGWYWSYRVVLTNTSHVLAPFWAQRQLYYPERR